MNHFAKCIYNLRQLSVIAPGQKISTRGEYLEHDPAGAYTVAARTRSDDGRKKMIWRVNEVVSASVELADRTIESKYFCKEEKNNAPMRIRRISELKQLWECLNGAIRGIEGQCVTYPCDATVGAGVEHIVTQIREATTRIRLFLQSIGEDVYI